MLDLRGRKAARQPDAEAPAGKVQPLPVWDREVIEVLVGVPDAAGLIVHEVGSAGLESQAARAVLAAAARLHDAGRPVGLGDLLLEIADPGLQSLLVALDETGPRLGASDPEERLRQFTDTLERRSAAVRARASARSLKTDQLDSRAEAELLERLVAERRVAQGMAEPMEG
jgi:hypothetical protein